MHTLYDSDTFVVTHLQANADMQEDDKNTPTLVRHGFEIVDKRRGREVYLDGSWAELFQQQINAWQAKTPTQEEVEDALEGYVGLAHQPVVVH